MAACNYDWTYVKKKTLWHYEELLKKLTVLPTYPKIWQAYDHSMPQAAEFAQCLFGEAKISNGEYPSTFIGVFTRLQASGVDRWSDFLAQVNTREKFVVFVEKNGFVFEEVIDILHYLLRCAFPFHTASRALLDHDNPQEMDHYTVFKQYKLMCSFDLLERSLSRSERRSLSKQTGLPFDFLTSISHRADIARLPFVRRKTILPLCGAGYDTLAKIAGADLATMESDMDAYFRRRQGKSWGDFKSVIVLRGLVTGAKALPKLVLS